MKTILKSMTAAVLCAVIMIAGISTESGRAFAAGKKEPFKVGFKNTVVSLIKDVNHEGARGDTPTIKKLEEKWGKPSKKKQNSTKVYTWEKGETTISVTDYDAVKGHVGSIHINIGDKNGSLCGVKVGMKTADALKKMEKAFGKKRVVLCKEGQYAVPDDNDGYVAEGEPTGDKEFISVYAGPYMPIGISLKNGKVSSISWWRS